MSAAFWPMMPLICVVCGGLGVMIVDSVVHEQDENALLAAVTLFVSAGISAGLWWSHADHLTSVPTLATYFAVDHLSSFFDILICLSGSLCSLLAGGYLREHGIERGEFYTVLLFTVLGAMVVAHATHFLTLFLGIEIMSLGVYSLVAYRRTNPRAAEAGVKYFLLGSFASALLLLGIVFLYGATGELELSKFKDSLVQGNGDIQLLILGIWFVLVGLAFKLGIAPFHMWAPDAYEGAATPVTTLMSITVKSAIVAVFIRVFTYALGDTATASGSSGWPSAMAGLAAFTMIVGNLAAITQQSVKRMLAYSSISHAGTLLLGIVAGFRLGGSMLSAVLYYLMAYAVSSVLAFGSLIWLGSRGREAVSYEDLAGAGRRHPMAGLAFALGIISLMGIPPTSGFFAKYTIYSAAIQVGGSLFWVALIGVVTSIIGAYYYLRVLVYLFMKSPEPEAPIAIPMRSSYVAFAIIIAGYFVLKMGITPSPYLEVAKKAIQDIS